MRNSFSAVAFLVALLGPVGCDPAGKVASPNNSPAAVPNAARTEPGRLITLHADQAAAAADVQSSPEQATNGPNTAGPAHPENQPGVAGEPSSANPAGAQEKAAKKPADADSANSLIQGPAGRIVGTVTFEGLPVPTPTVVTNDKDIECCGVKIKKQDVVISAENRGIMQVIVWVEDVKLPDGYKPPQQSLRLVTQKCQFRPHAAAMTVGSAIEVTNADTIAHAVQLTGAQEETIRLKNRGEEYTSEARHAGMIRVHCEDHEWMAAFVRVDPHPFHDVTDADGRFVIVGVPVGEYKLKVWHEKFLEQEIAVAVRVGETTSLKIHYPLGKAPPKRNASQRSPAGRPAVKK